MSFRLALVVWLTLAVLLPACGDDDDDASHAGDDDDDTESDDDDDDDNDTAPDDDDDDDNDTLDLAAYVDPFIATSGDRGQLDPAATVPFGMVKLGPDTLVINHSGYDYRSNRIRGFSHTRIGGVGCSGAGGSLRMMPFFGASFGGATKMRKDSETAAPGSYAATLDDESPLGVELTATAHAGFHRYTLAEPAALSVQITLDRPFDDYVDSEWTADGNEISGRVAGKNVCGYGAYTFYFSIVFDRPFTIEDGDSGRELTLHFDAGDAKTLMAKVGLSSVDADGAAANRDAEIPAWDFDATRAAARAAWNQHLSHVRVSGDEEYKTLFYTFLYRASRVPVDITGVDGRYRGTDGEVHEAVGYRRYHCWSLWDTYRTKYPLLTLVDPARAREIMRSLVDLYQQGKVDWATDLEPYPTVRTEHAGVILLDGLAKDIGDFGVADAFADIVAEADGLTADTPDKVLENSYDYWAVANIADYLDDPTTRDRFLARAMEYEATWNENFNVMGDDADVVHARGLYEGTLWQYRWAAVWDVDGMAALAGGREVFLGQLVEFFANELYNHGNEPDIHTPFLFNELGAPWRTQRLVRDLLTNSVNQWYGTHEKWLVPYYGRIFAADPVSYFPEMDDDVGTMAAWFVMAAMGLYQTTVGNPEYQLTAPIFDEVVLATADGGEFRIRALDLSAENVYIESATLNGEALTVPWIAHETIAAGGELVFQMSAEPNPDWGAPGR